MLLVGCAGGRSARTITGTATPTAAAITLSTPRSLDALWRDSAAAENAWVLGHIIVIHYRGGVVWGRDARTGTSRWIHGYADGRRVDASERAVLIADPGVVTALDPSTGEARWTTDLIGADVIEGVAVVGEVAAVAYRSRPRGVWSPLRSRRTCESLH